MAYPRVTNPETGKEIVLTKKFQLWMEYFNDPKSETHGNATQSAIKAYGLDKEKQYQVARQMGTENLAKHDVVARDFFERTGRTWDKLMQALWIKAINPKVTNPGWFDRLVYYTKLLPEYKNDQPISQTQVNIFNGTPEDKKDFNEKFKEFLEGKTSE